MRNQGSGACLHTKPRINRVQGLWGLVAQRVEGVVGHKQGRGVLGAAHIGSRVCGDCLHTGSKGFWVSGA